MPRITAVTTSVGYADIQRHTLPSLCGFADRVIVVTEPGDDAIDLAAKCRAETIVTGAAVNRGAVFNKAGLVRAGQLEAASGPDDWVLIVDADVLIDPSFRYAANVYLTNKTALYASRRCTAKTQHDFTARHWPMSDDNVGLGYFQLYNPHGCGNPLYPEWSYAADACDMEFKKLFPEIVVLPFSVVHLGPTETNWFGRKSPRWS